MLKYALSIAFAVKPSLVYGVIKSRMSDIIPFNSLVGIEIVSIGDGIAEARLPFRPEITNHIGSVHATAIFGLAEAASGGAMSGAFAPVATSIRPVAASATVEFSKIARTDLAAFAKTSLGSKELRETLERDGKVVFNVAVNLRDAAGTDVGQVTVSWHVSNKK
ncbi:uncharacterized protein (TIGR00369 family) [Bradyrhizobium sp. USDA 3240]